MIGSVVSHYRVEEHLGGGGMGVVYRGLDLHLDRPVALKFLPAHLGTSYEVEVRFVQEAKAASALDHSHIVTIFDIDRTDEGQLFIVMAYYPGETLKKRIRRGPMPMAEAVLSAIQVAEALEEAHNHGIVHRDIKPSNILLTEEGKAKLVDFGLARLVEDTTLTDPGAVVGTTLYMSPEQIRGERVDHRTDIWSLAVVLYEMVTGRQPFKGPTAAAVMHAILEAKTPRLRDHAEVASEELQDILDRALNKDPGERYAHIGDMLLDLRELFLTLTAPTRTVPVPRPIERHWRRERLIYLAVAAVAVVLVVLVWLNGRLPDPDAVHLRAPPIQNSDARRYFDQALEYERRGDLRVHLENAERLMRAALAAEPDNEHIESHLADVLVRLQLSYPDTDRSEEAERLIESALAREPPFPCALVAEGYLEILRGDYEGAEASARRAVELAPESSRARTLLGEALAGLGQEEEALKTLRAAIELQDGQLWAHPTLARLLMNLGRDNEAIQEYRTIIQFLPDSPNALNNLGAIYARQGEYEQAEPLFRRILEVQPDSMAAMNLATIDFYLGRMDEAGELYLRAHELEPTDPLVQANLGEYYEEIGDPESSRLWYEKAVATYDDEFMRQPPSAEARSDRAYYAAKAGRMDEAIQGIVAAVTATERDQLQPDSLVLFQAAKIYALAGRRAETLSFARQAIAAGYPGAQFAAEPCFRGFLDDPDFRDLIGLARSP